MNEQQREKQRVQTTRAARSVSFAVFLSRILGLVREQVFAKLFGAGILNEAFQVAFRIPNLLRDLFAEGALSSAFVPTFTDYLRRKGRTEAWLLANLVVGALLLLLGVITLILLFFSDQFVYLLAAGFAKVPGKLEVTSNLIKILSPFLMLIALASVVMGMLNTLNHFFLPALAPALFNVAIIGSGFFLVPWFERQGIVPIYAMGVGAVVGGLLQLVVQLPILHRYGYRLRLTFDFDHEGFRRIARLVAPALLGISAVQINVVVNTQLASFLQANGPVSWLGFAFRVLYLPIGLFGVAVGVVNLRQVSHLAAEEKWEDIKATVAHSIKLISLLSLPSTVGLIVLANPIVELIFERGRFSSSDTTHTAYALMCYSLGLFSYSCVKIYAPTFYALGDTRTPVRSSIVAVATNISVNLALIALLPTGYKYLGLATGTSLSMGLNNALLAHAFRARLGTLQTYKVVSTVGKNMIAAGVMGVVLYALNQWFQSARESMGTLQLLVSVSSSIGVGVLVYFVSCRLLGVEEVRYIFSRLRT